MDRERSDRMGDQSQSQQKSTSGQISSSSSSSNDGQLGWKMCEPSDIEWIMSSKLEIVGLIKLLNHVIIKFQSLKKPLQGPLLAAVEKAIFNWMDSHPEQFHIHHGINYRLHGFVQQQHSKDEQQQPSQHSVLRQQDNVPFPTVPLLMKAKSVPLSASPCSFPPSNVCGANPDTKLLISPTSTVSTFLPSPTSPCGPPNQPLVQQLSVGQNTNTQAPASIEESLTETCDKLFEVLDTYCENNSKRKCMSWPLQILLLVLCPKILEELVNAETGAPVSSKHLKKRKLLEDMKKSIYNSGRDKAMTETAIVSAVKLAKAATYISNRDSNNCVFLLLQSIIADLKSLLFNPTKPFTRSQSTAAQDSDLMIDCFMSLLRITPHNDEILKVCLHPQSPPLYHYVAVTSLNRIATQPRLAWWPEINVVYLKAPELRALFTDTLSKVSSNLNPAHAPLRMMQSLSLKKEVNPLSSDVLSPRSLLLGIVRLIHSDPVLILSNQSKDTNANTTLIGPPASGEKAPNTQNQQTQSPVNPDASVSISTIEVINGLVSLVYQPTMPDVAQEAMDALLVLHEPEVINKWNPESPVITFWDVSSQLIFSISQRLINRQISNYTEVLMWLKEILRRKNLFLSMHRENANQGSDLPICRQAHIKLEHVFFMYMWSIDLEAGLVSMSCFGLLCEEADIRCGSDDLAGTYLVPNYQVYQELTHSSTLLTPGRAALQKRIMAILRKIEHCTQGISQAWEDTLTSWNSSTKEILSYPKKHNADDSDRSRPQGEGSLHRTTSKRRTSSYYTTDHELEDQFNEWVNMTGFLCSLGGITLQRKSPAATNANTTFLDRKPPYNYNQDSAQPVIMFIHQILRLLVIQNERFGTQIQKHVKELLSHELSPVLYPILFDQIRLVVDGFFDPQLHVNESETNTQFINHIMYILRCVLEKDQNCEHLGVNSIESTMLNVVRYLRHLDSNELLVVQMKTKFCFLMVAMMNRREDLALRQEMKFRNKMVEYVTDWVMGSSHNQPVQHYWSPELNVYLRDLDHAAMMAVASLLRGLPLQPEESDRGDLRSAKSSLFLKYFNLFLKILEDCCEPNLNEEDLFRDMPRFTAFSRERDGSSKTNELRTYTIQAMSNLLSANIDSGLADSLALGYHRDYLTRVAFMEVLTRILEQGTEFDMLAETVLHDRYEQLVQLVTMIGDKGELPIAMALAHVVVTSQMDELARVFVTLFDAKHLLPSLLWNIFYKEVEVLDCMKTLFRGNSLASKIMSFCFKIYGTEYLKSLLEPLILPLTEDDSASYEIDPNRVPEGDVLDENRKNLLALTKKVYDTIIGSTDRFPPQLRSMCHCLYQVLNKRFHSNTPANVSAVGTVIFLRFINPAIVSPFESGIIEREPSVKVRRGLMLMSKILQNIANHVEFSKEQHMKYFNEFIKENFETGRNWVLQITSDCEQTEQSMTSGLISHGSTWSSAAYASSHNPAMISGINIAALHRLLWFHQDKMSDYLSSSRDNKAVGRRPFDKMVTLLAYLGPPEQRTAVEHSWDEGQVESSQFEQLMTEMKMNELDDYKELKASNIFYQAGTSKSGNPVFYYIARRYNVNETNCDLLIYLVLLSLKSAHNKPFELVMDLTHSTALNRFRKEVLRKLFMVLPEAVSDRIKACYVYNCNSWVKEYTKYHDAFSVLRGNRKILFLDSLARLSEYIDPDKQKLPGATLSLEEDLKVFYNSLKLDHKDTKVLVKIGHSHFAIQALEKAKVLGQAVYLNDIYDAAEIDEVCLLDENQLTVSINDVCGQPTLLSVINPDVDPIVTAIVRVRSRWEMSQPDTVVVHATIRPKDVPGTLLNMALLNLGSSESTLRTAAYNLLLCLMQSFELKIPPQLLNELNCFTSANSYMSSDLNRDILIQVICKLSDTLASSASHLTLEFLEESIHGYENSDLHHKQLCLNYMIPWLTNLTRFRKHSDGHKRTKVNIILDKLVDMTKIDPSLRPKIFPLLRRMRAQHEPRNPPNTIGSGSCVNNTITNSTSPVSAPPEPNLQLSVESADSVVQCRQPLTPNSSDIPTADEPPTDL